MEDSETVDWTTDSSSAGQRVRYHFTRHIGPPTRFLFLGNVGPEVCSWRGHLQQLLQPFCQNVLVEIPEPAASHAYAIMDSEEQAAAAISALHEKPCESLEGRRLSVRYAKARLKVLPAPPPCVARTAEQAGVPGLHLLHDFITADEEAQLLQHTAQGDWVRLAKRRVQHYGWEFDYTTRLFSKKLGPLPTWVQPLAARIEAQPFVSQPLDQLTVNEYPPGVGIAPHFDTHSAFTGAIVILSCGSDVVMEFRTATEQRPMLLPRRSLLVMTHAARYAWQHYIPHRKVDVMGPPPSLHPSAQSDSIQTSTSSAAQGVDTGDQGCDEDHAQVVHNVRGVRTSFTFRLVRGHPCDCAWPEHCDSRQGGPLPTRLGQLLKEGLLPERGHLVQHLQQQAEHEQGQEEEHKQQDWQVQQGLQGQGGQGQGQQGQGQVQDGGVLWPFETMQQGVVQQGARHAARQPGVSAAAGEVGPGTGSVALQAGSMIDLTASPVQAAVDPLQGNGQTCSSHQLQDCKQVQGNGYGNHPACTQVTGVVSGSTQGDSHAAIGTQNDVQHHGSVAVAQSDGQAACEEQHDGTAVGTTNSDLDKAAEQLEAEHVHAVYDAIASHFSATRFAIWPKVKQFISQLPAGAVVADVGCGNGKYFGVRPDIMVLGAERSAGLAQVAARRLQPIAPQLPLSIRADVLQADALRLPYRSSSLDGVLCIAVLHHISSTKRRMAILQELLRVLKPGGRALVTVWAVEQEEPHKTIQKWIPFTPLEGSQDNTGSSDSPDLEQEADLASRPAVAAGKPPVGAGLDFMVPWHVPFHRAGAAAAMAHVKPQPAGEQSAVIGMEGTESATDSTIVPAGADSASAGSSRSVSPVLTQDVGKGAANGAADVGHLGSAKAVATASVSHDKGAVVFKRYYHLFEEGELERLVDCIPGCKRVDNFYDKSNWCVVYERC